MSEPLIVVIPQPRQGEALARIKGGIAAPRANSPA